MIRTKTTKNFKAVCALQANHRWCVTGTPIQNRLTDLASLLHFLRVSPFDDSKYFETEISQPWKTQVDEKALLRLKSLVKLLALRRSRAVVELPARKDEVHFLTFDTGERAAYEKAKISTLSSIEAAMGEPSNRGSVYFNALQRINELRMICSQGFQFIHTPRRKLRGSRKRWRKGTDVEAAEQLELLMSTADQACIRCGTDLEESSAVAQLRPLIDWGQESSGELRRTCQECLELESSVSSSDTATSASDCASEIALADPSTFYIPSKIKALASHLQRNSDGEKR
jgi:SWI/SNF-related matrix-associated actin-dependent regulator of chromatin subfamily A3